MAKIIAVDRKLLMKIVGTAFLALFALTVIALWKDPAINTNKVLNPEVKMVNVTLEPASFTQDLTYGSLTIKGAQVIPAKTFDLTATIQNTTGQPMSNLALELEISLLGDSTQKNIIPAQVEALNSGESIKVTFRGVKALGDAEGKNAAAGQHLFVLRVKANPAGGITKPTEASFRFVVDSTVKAPAK